MVFFRFYVPVILCFLLATNILTAPANETVLFGFNVPLTGAYSKQGEDQLRAYKLAVKIINARGGVYGNSDTFQRNNR